jgi:3-oxoacyl-[acyl-carrier protein] reductase
MATRIDRTDAGAASAPSAWADLEKIQIGAHASCRLAITSEMIDGFAMLSADINPLHVDADAARECGFPRRVAHGMLALSAVSRLIGTRLPGPGSLWLSQELKFVAPVFVGDVLDARVTVEQVSRGAQTVTLRTEVTNVTSGTEVLVGTARVQVVARATREATATVQDRVAIVTGSSRGLGRAIASRLAAAGVKTVVHYHRRADDAESLVHEIGAKAGAAVACQADLTDEAGADVLFTRACDAFGKVDIIVHNATPPIVRKPLLDWGWSEFETYVNAYVRACFRLTQLAAPGMQERHFGRFVHILSAAAHGAPPPRLAAYVTAKTALAGLSRAMAVELGPFGITVNAVSPSVLLTDQMAAMGERAKQLAASQTPLRRLGNVDEVADAVAFLASDAARYITGAVLPVTGGETMSL